jgi:hypothetical protein
MNPPMQLPRMSGNPDVGVVDRLKGLPSSAHAVTQTFECRAQPKTDLRARLTSIACNAE